jgi:hypothetical protein
LEYRTELLHAQIERITLANRYESGADAVMAVNATCELIVRAQVRKTGTDDGWWGVAGLPLWGSVQLLMSERSLGPVDAELISSQLKSDTYISFRGNDFRIIGPQRSGPWQADWTGGEDAG